MAQQNDFTEQEWETMHKGVTGAGMLVALADRGFFDTFKEAGALGRHLAQARESSQSEVVRELAGRRGTGFGLTAPPAEVESETIAALRDSIATLEQKAPTDADEYRRFVLTVAESVAEAAGGGDTAENAALEKIRSVLDGEAAA